VVLAEMDPDRGHARDVDAVVDEHTRAEVAAHSCHRLDLWHQFPIGHGLFPDLHAADPDLEEPRGDLGVRGERGSGRGVSIRDRVDPGKADGHAGSDPSQADAANRSMKWVESFPSMKSGSSRIRRCSGIVVLIPSTTKKSSARRPR